MLRHVLVCQPPASPDYRYLLRVALSPSDAAGPQPDVQSPPSRHLLVLLKNPSTADAVRADPTTGKVEAWAQRHGFVVVTYVNLFARRSPRPAALNPLDYAAAVGAQNDAAIVEAVAAADVVVAAWGNPNGIDLPRYRRRIAQVLALLAAQPTTAALHTVGVLTRQGYPRHGLQWDRDAGLHRWQPT